MRPEKLTITAFGSFVDKTVIDFTLFGKEGLYLVSGDTGSGKTTIFDALSYALYGQTTSDGDRSAELMRSHYAKEDVYTEVSLEFTEKGKRYFITRTPKQKISKKKGTGLKEVPSNVELTLPDGNIVTKIDQANAKIVEIIGMSANQFSQIVMLAQGQFSRFLKSKTEEKRELFAKIFSTENYAKLQNALSDKAKEARDEYYDVLNKEKIIIGNINLSEDSAYFEEFESAKNAPSLPENMKDLLRGIETERKTKYEESDSSYKALEKQVAEIEQKIGKCDEKKRLSVELEEKRAEESLLSSELIKAEENKAENEYRREIISNYKIEVFRLENTLSSYDKKVELETKLSERRLELSKEGEEKILLEKSFEETDEELKLSEEKRDSLRDIQAKLDQERDNNHKLELKLKELDILDKKLQEKEKIREDIENCSVALDSHLKKASEIVDGLNAAKALKKEEDDELNSLEDVEIKIERIRASLKNARTLKEGEDKIKELKKEEWIHEDSLSVAQNVLTGAKFFYKKGLSIFLNNSAVNLASHLEDGKPCPVCGAKHHPSPATISDGEMSEDYLNLLKKREEEAQEKVNTKESALNTIRSQISFIDGQNQKVRSSFEQSLSSLEAEKIISVLEDEENSLNAKLDRKMELKANLEKLSSDISSIENEQREIKDIIIKLETAIDGKEKSRDAIEAEVGKPAEELGISLSEFPSIFDSCQKAKALSDRLLLDYDKSAKEYRELLSAIEDLRKKRDSLKDKVTSSSMHFELLTAEYIRLKKDLEETCKKLEFDNKEIVLSKIASLKDTNEKLSKAIEDSEKSYKEISDRKVSLLGEISTIEKQIEALPDYERSALEEEKREVDAKRDEEDNRRSSYKAQLDLISASIASYEENETIAFARREKWNSLYELSSVANGTLSGVDRITLETYVQTRYLDRILRRANRKLLSMSNSQYEMERSSNARNKAQKMGLDIDIMDHHIGKVRPATTLSGGEMFKASLALALGLSEEIQASSGAVKIETMFIDEGFGTLDEESLHSALEILSSLASSGRLVGIISHVQELKDKISSQIVVKKRNDRSTITITV